MNIDVTALLSGGADLLPAKGKFTGADFAVALDDKLQNLGLVHTALPTGPAMLLPGDVALADLMPELEAAVLPVELSDALPSDLAAALDSLVPQQGETLVEQAEREADPLALLETLVPGNPQWQLQQLVSHNVASAAENGITVKAAKDPAPLTEAFGALAKAAATETKTPGPGKEPSLASMIASSSAAPQHSETLPGNEASVVAAVAAPVSAPVRNNVSISAVATVPYAPQTPEWKQAVSQQIVMFSRNGVHNAEIRLHPEELGSLQISLRLHQEQAQIHIVSEHAQVRHALEQAMPQLRAAMAESGLQLSQASVSADNPYAGAGAQGESSENQHPAPQQGDENSVEEETSPVVINQTAGNIHGINTFA
ncbi:flagellar hook-length control protein FliK [Pantoea sp. BRR-3P]|uniref:flagellar hook-length control protein FliK n=1 Tax=Pantoea sp. BRR-3P TaxID=3141541 RepID=UPI0031F56DC2